MKKPENRMTENLLKLPLYDHAGLQALDEVRTAMNMQLETKNRKIFINIEEIYYESPFNR